MYNFYLFFYFIFKRTTNEIKQYLVSGLTIVHLRNKHILGVHAHFLRIRMWAQNKLQGLWFWGEPSELMQPPQRLKDGMLVGFSNRCCFVSTIPSQCGNPICDRICFKVNLLLFSPCSWSHSSDETRLCPTKSVLVLLCPSRPCGCCSEMVDDEANSSISELGSKSETPPIRAIVKIRLPENLETI